MSSAIAKPVEKLPQTEVATSLERAATPYDDKMYSAEWRAWRDPDIPDWIDPVGLLLDRHIGTAGATKTAVMFDGHAVSYAELARLVARHAGGLATLGLFPEQRVLLFGTD